MVSRLVSYYKTSGRNKTDLFSAKWGSFDTHTNQRGVSATPLGLDDSIGRFGEMHWCPLQAALDQTGMANDCCPARDRANFMVARWMRPQGLVLTVLGGIIRSSWAMPLKALKMYGAKFPSLVLGGTDDAHPQKRGYWVPQISSDQVAADFFDLVGVACIFLAVSFAQFDDNFSNKTVGFMGA
jgi:hypothetical protein